MDYDTIYLNHLFIIFLMRNLTPFLKYLKYERHENLTKTSILPGGRIDI